jgi:RpiR family carbohydrate utilization transcriptional regulator
MDEIAISVIQNIHKNYEGLFAAEQKVADYILKNPEKAVEVSVSELAESSGASDATVIRFSKRLGYTGFYQMKLHLAQELGRNQILGGAKITDNPESPEDLMREVASNIVHMGSNINQENLRQLISEILAANTVHLAAVGNSIPVINDFGFRLGRAGVRASYSAVVEQQLNYINLGKPGDIVIAISHSGSSKHVLSAFELAKKRGLRTVVITDRTKTPVKDVADLTLSTGVEWSSVFVYGAASHIYISALIDMIIYFITKAKDQSDYDLEIVLSETKM